MLVLECFKCGRKPSRKFVQGNGLGRLTHCSQQCFNSAHCFRGEEHIAAGRTDFRGNVVDDYHLALMTHRVNDQTLFVLTGTTLDAALHGNALLFEGVIHLGGFGSYAVTTMSFV